jgi:hypothetical protein
MTEPDEISARFNPTYRYSLEYPDSWEDFPTWSIPPRSDVHPAIDLSFEMNTHPRNREAWSGLWLKPIPNGNPQHLSIWVGVDERQPISFEEFRRLFQASVETRGERFDGARPDFMLDGFPAWEVRWSVGDVRFNRLVVAFRDGLRYVLQLGGIEPELSEHTPAFEAMLASFRFFDEGPGEGEDE